ncbi:alpha/beta hydrolase [Lysobacter sp. KIS68-7]|uniref:alpha/beta fold hydrolase n=1 Tax=Lysobacter sp. KIS68-7 TaxID=2904252 RepID=UPI001E387216|nr:alpha/beta hydrolase [Lysobacter sp. KIS68-7]UHQ20201.1 alpha/beta hydrolase [Lysobacter sp. KIS68-7]
MTALVVLPGLDGTATMLSAFADAARSHFSSVQVIAYPRDRALGYRALEELVRAKLPIAGAFVLLGESFSGPVAMSIAGNPPAGLVGLVLSTTFSKAPIPLLAPLASFAAFAPVRLPTALLSWFLLGRWSTPELRSSLASALALVSPTVLRSRAAAALRADASASLGAISIPVLYLRATQDRLLPATTIGSITAAIPHASVVDIPGPHLLLQAAPERAAKVIADHWGGQAG